MRLCIRALLSVLFFACSSCSSVLPPIEPVAKVDLSRFMGRWYVIAAIPSWFERNAWNAVETYELHADNEVYTDFRFNSGAFDGPVKHIHSVGYVHPNSGDAVWGVQVFWPIKAQYVVAYLQHDYSQTIIARDARDYVWLMARTPSISEADYAALIARVKVLGYDASKIRKVPQRWPDSDVTPRE